MSGDTPPTGPGEGEAVRAAAARAVLHRALRLLARRDHSVAELRRKLDGPDIEGEMIEAAIESLREDGALDDARYAREYTGQRVDRGFGPMLIRARLVERGVAASLVDEALSDFEGDWQAMATAALQRRFDAATITSGNDRDAARASRFLASRGFDRATAFRAWRAFVASAGREADGDDD